MTAAGDKILAGAREALAIARGEAEPARIHHPKTRAQVLAELPPERRASIEQDSGRMIAEHRSKTREPHRAASARTDTINETSHPAASPREAEEG